MATNDFTDKMNKIYQSNQFFSTLIMTFYITLCLLLQNFIIYEDIVLTKIMRQKEGGQANADRADKGWRGVGEMLTMADKGGKEEVWTPLIFG